MTNPQGPLQGVKVVACSTAQAGTVPYMLMADLGAEVIKIEVPQVGDNLRGSTSCLACRAPISKPTTVA
jgi:crotonobetainyl-CoA:carnitine CoA-transferase CaiB-like acyl-CoA transferase